MRNLTTDDLSTYVERSGPRRVYCDGRLGSLLPTKSRMRRTKKKAKGQNVCAITDELYGEARREMGRREGKSMQDSVKNKEVVGDATKHPLTVRAGDVQALVTVPPRPLPDRHAPGVQENVGCNRGCSWHNQAEDSASTPSKGHSVIQASAVACAPPGTDHVVNTKRMHEAIFENTRSFTAEFLDWTR